MAKKKKSSTSRRRRFVMQSDKEVEFHPSKKIKRRKKKPK